MYLTHLSLTDFRNFSRFDLAMPRGVLLMVGDNAQGKTSLLEAVYYLATLSSFHADSDRQLINFFAADAMLAVARIVADFSSAGHSHRVEVRIIQETNGGNGASRLRKEVLLDGVKHKASDALGRFIAVLFLPQMLSVIDGSPEERRRYLNLALSQVFPYYPQALSSYNQALAQRNALLKLLYERGGDSAQLDYWDGQLATSGAQLVYARICAVQELERLAVRLHHELTRGGEVLRIKYLPSYDPVASPDQYVLPIDTVVDRSGISVEQIRLGFLERLAGLRGDEIERGVTTVGPHRDELRFLANGIDLGLYGSRGQVRTAILALKLAEGAWMKERTGNWPVLLLDEVLAELDPQRRLDLLSRLSQYEQVMLTTTDLDLFEPEFVRQAEIWHIQSGRLAEAEHGA